MGWFTNGRARTPLRNPYYWPHIKVHGNAYSTLNLANAWSPDVVPVNPDTLSEWEHPPYSGYFMVGSIHTLRHLLLINELFYYQGKYIWGRGVTDDKSGLIGIL